MSLLWWRKSARRDLTHQNAVAENELRTSRALLAQDRRTIVAPLRYADERNHFSDMIRSALDVGYGNDSITKGGGST